MRITTPKKKKKTMKDEILGYQIVPFTKEKSIN